MAILQTNEAFRQVFANNKDLNCITDEESAKLKSVLLEMMDDIDTVCQKHNLTYFLCGGSALGAVRHKGFIPWDDDMDIAMLRKDYDLFREYMKEDMSDKYWVQYIEDNEHFESNFMKLRLKGTRCVELFEPDPPHAGIFIDVYPLEDTYDNSLLRKLHGYHGELLLLICSCVRLLELENRILPYLEDKKTIRTVKAKCFIGKLLSFRTLHKWLCRTERVLTKCKNPNSEFISIPSGRMHYFGEMYHRDSFLPARRVQFEDRTYSIMNNPDEYLTAMYKNYMEIPKKKPEKHAILELKFRD